MDRMGTVTNPVKKGTTWLAEKASHVKFGGMASGNPALGTFVALETLALGVQGKICLWRSLGAIGKAHAILASVNSISSSSGARLSTVCWSGNAWHGAFGCCRTAPAQKNAPPRPVETLDLIADSQTDVTRVRVTVTSGQPARPRPRPAQWPGKAANDRERVISQTLVASSSPRCRSTCCMYSGSMPNKPR